MNLGELKTRVYRTFGDEAAVQITDADIVRWANDGQRMICMQNETVLQTSSLSSSVINQQDYSLPATMLVLRGLHYKRPGDTSFFKLRAMSMQEFDEWVDGWEGTYYGTSTPEIYTVYNNTIKLFPIPDQSGTSNIKIYYSREPVDVASDSDTLDLPLTYHNAIVSYCLQQAYMLDEDWSAAGNVSQMMQNDVKALKERENWNNWEAYPRITVNMEDEW